MTTYAEFLDRKLHTGADHGFDPVFMPPQLFDFQQALVKWAVRKGRAAIFADCGLGKTAMQLTWAENVARHTGRPVLILTPFMGVGSEVYGAVQAGRRGVGIELKPSYYRQAVRNLELAGEPDQPGDQSSLFDLETA